MAADPTGTSLPLALTMGEPAGIGLEITLKAWHHFATSWRPGADCFFLIDDPVRVARARRALGSPVQVATIGHPSEAANAFGKALPVLPLLDIDLPADLETTFGKPGTETAGAVIGSIDQAVELALNGDVAGIVTNPIQKKTLLDSGFTFPGHTEYLGALTEKMLLPDGLVRGPVMLLAGESLRVAPVTVHIPLSEVPGALSPELIANVAVVVAQSLQRDFGIVGPRLAVSGLNPHAGEGGALGKEDMEIIAPAIAWLREKGIDAIGPLPADTMFHQEARAQYHAAITMYHDQGLIPVKTLAFHTASNITLGLPIIRTSPDHGTGLDIAGKNVARPDSLISSIMAANAMARQRQQFDLALRQQAG